MPALLSSGSTTITPLALSYYTSDQQGGTIVHPIIGRRDPDVTLRPVALRTGSVTLDFATEAAAATARTNLSAAASWSLTHSERPSVNMRFVVRTIGRVVDGDRRWSLTIGYEEVP